MNWIIEFSIFLVLQSLFINGIKYCFEKDSIFYKIATDFFDLNKGKLWTYPIYACVRCMAGAWGVITFIPAAIALYGFKWQEIPLLIFDIGCLISLNWLVYKKM